MQRSLLAIKSQSLLAFLFTFVPWVLRFEAAEEKQRQRVLENRAAAFGTAGRGSGSKEKTSTTTTTTCGVAGGRKRASAVGESKRGRRKVNCGTFMTAR